MDHLKTQVVSSDKNKYTLFSMFFKGYGYRMFKAKDSDDKECIIKVLNHSPSNKNKREYELCADWFDKDGLTWMVYGKNLSETEGTDYFAYFSNEVQDNNDAYTNQVNNTNDQLRIRFSDTDMKEKQEMERAFALQKTPIPKGLRTPIPYSGETNNAIGKFKIDKGDDIDYYYEESDDDYNQDYDSSDEDSDNSSCDEFKRENRDLDISPINQTIRISSQPKSILLVDSSKQITNSIKYTENSPSSKVNFNKKLTKIPRTPAPKVYRPSINQSKSDTVTPEGNKLSQPDSISITDCIISENTKALNVLGTSCHAISGEWQVNTPQKSLQNNSILSRIDFTSHALKNNKSENMFKKTLPPLKCQLMTQDSIQIHGNPIFNLLKNKTKTIMNCCVEFDLKLKDSKMLTRRKSKNQNCSPRA